MVVYMTIIISFQFLLLSMKQFKTVENMCNVNYHLYTKNQPRNVHANFVTQLQAYVLNLLNLPDFFYFKTTKHTAKCIIVSVPQFRLFSTLSIERSFFRFNHNLELDCTFYIKLSHPLHWNQIMSCVTLKMSMLLN